MFHPLTKNGDYRSRRHFLRKAGALAVGMTCARSLLATARSRGAVITHPGFVSGEAGLRQTPFTQIGILLGTFAESALEAKPDALTTIRSRTEPAVETSVVAISQVAGASPSVR